MSEDLQKINTWIEGEPLDMFSSLAEGPTVIGFSDEDIMAACKGVSTARAQLVVNYAYAALATKGEELQEEQRIVQRELEDLDAEHLARRSSALERLEETGKLLAIVSEVAHGSDTSNCRRLGAESSQEHLSSEAQRVVGLIERSGSPEEEEIINLFIKLGPFEVSFVTTSDGNHLDLTTWLEEYKLKTNYVKGQRRTRKDVALERVANRFHRQGFSRFSGGDGFEFLKKLPKNVVKLNTVMINDKEMISSFTVLEPESFLKIALKNSYAGGLDKAGPKAMLGLRLIAEIQKTKS